MMRNSTRLVAVAVAFFCIAAARHDVVESWSMAPTACETLASFTLTDGRVTSAAVVQPGGFMPPGSNTTSAPAPYANLPGFCRVAAMLTPTTDSDIKIEVWMPLSNWNQQLQAVGNGGWAGSISYGAMAAALAQGYA